MKIVQHEGNMKSEKNSETQKERNAVKGQHGKGKTWRKCNMKNSNTNKVQQENMKHEKSVQWKKCNMKEV